MRILFLSFLLSINLILLSQTYNVGLTVTGIESVEGTINIGLFNDEDNFPKSGGEIQVYTIQVNGLEESIVMDKLTAGDYAISLYHDRNADKVCNRNFIGIPKEDYGFSNNFRPLFRVPRFEDCFFTVKSDTSIIIRLIN